MAEREYRWTLAAVWMAPGSVSPPVASKNSERNSRIA
jgi:hypothetical protein